VTGSNLQADKARHTWLSSGGFLLAAAGAATGLGGLWRFPFIAGENGGGAFVLLYLFFVIIIGMPIMMAEMAIGRMGKRSAYGSVERLVTTNKKPRPWLFVGFLSVLIPFFGLSYYAVVAGWALDYLFLAASGHLSSTTPEAASAAFNEGTTAPFRQIILHASFIALTVIVVARGVSSGIERVSKFMMPALFIILTILTIYNMITGAGAEAASFLFKPDFSKINGSVALMAMGQALFSLAVGVGVLITYSAYSSDRDSLPKAVCVIAGANTFVALLAGLAIFSVVFKYGLDVDSGPGLLFVTLPVAFAQMPGGMIVATLFFLLVVFAAYTTTIGMLEPVVAWLEERFDWGRTKLAWLAGISAWLAGLLPVLSFNLLSDWHPLSMIAILEGKTVFDLYDFFITTMLLPLNALLIALFTGWVIGARRIGDVLGLGTGVMYTIWALLLRFILPAAILILWLNSWASA
jgi:NSS family neurotransmitter:Na+ symporter